jgi:IS30 family transposase
MVCSIFSPKNTEFHVSLYTAHRNRVIPDQVHTFLKADYSQTIIADKLNRHISTRGRELVSTTIRRRRKVLTLPYSGSRKLLGDGRTDGS